MSNNTAAAHFATGYQNALDDLGAALTDGGGDALLTWLRDNAHTPATRDVAQQYLDLVDDADAGEQLTLWAA